MNLHILLLTILFIQCYAIQLEADVIPRFSNVFQSHMVLQRNMQIKLWGLSGSALNVTVHFGPHHGCASVENGTIKDGKWHITLPAFPATPKYVSYNLQLYDSNLTLLQNLTDILIGDTFLCSGQSNIDVPQQYANQFNEADQMKEESIADAVGNMIRIMIVPNQVSGLHYNATPQYELTDVPDCKLCGPAFKNGTYTYCQCNAMKWTRSSATTTRGFSATCWYLGKSIFFGVLKSSVPVGLVRSSWGGTKIHKWQSSEAIAKCPQEGKVPSDASFLWNGMINPLIGLHFSAVVWYQGESNVGTASPYQGAEYYQCALPAMIANWKNNFAVPFHIVELSAYCNEHDAGTFLVWCDETKSILKAVDYHLPALRLAQAAAEMLPGVWITSAMDLGTLHPLKGSIHPAAKEPLGVRLSLGIQNSTYTTDVIWHGPIPTSAVMTVGEQKHTSVTVTFTTAPGAGGIVLNTSAVCPEAILNVYCPARSNASTTMGNFEVLVNNEWIIPSKIHSEGMQSIVLETTDMPTRVRYAFADWPVVSVRNKVGNLPARIFDIAVQKSF